MLLVTCNHTCIKSEHMLIYAQRIYVDDGRGLGLPIVFHGNVSGSLLSWAYSSSTHYVINRMFHRFFHDSVKRIYILYEIRNIFTLIYVSLASDPGYFMH